jgi:hypothetical protein
MTYVEAIGDGMMRWSSEFSVLDDFAATCEIVTSYGRFQEAICKCLQPDPFGDYHRS